MLWHVIFIVFCIWFGAFSMAAITLPNCCIIPIVSYCVLNSSYFLEASVFWHIYSSDD